MPLSTMQDYPLTIRPILEHGRTIHANSKVITFTGDGYVESTFAEVADRADQLAAALTRLGVQPGDRVGTFMWNNQTHLEAYLAVPCMGAVLHTLNIRLFPEQLSYVINHAEDQVIIVDASIIPLLAKVRDQLTTVEAHHRQGCRRHLGARRHARLRHACSPPRSRASTIPISTSAAGMAMCYTSGTTGQPEGRDVQPSQHVPALDDGHVDRQHRARRERPDAGDRADVPRQRVGHAVRGVDGRRRPGVPAAVPAGRAAGADHRGDAADADRRGADGADRPVDQRPRRRPVVAAPRDVRWVGGAAGADRGLLRRLRRADRAGLGHDRDQPGVRDRSSTEGHGWRRRGHVAGAHRPRPSRRRAAHHRRQRRDGAVGRRVARRDRGPRPVDHRLVLPASTIPRSSTTAGCAPATSLPCRRMAT